MRLIKKPKRNIYHFLSQHACYFILFLGKIRWNNELMGWVQPAPIIMFRKHN